MKKLFKILLYIFVVIIALLIVSYFSITSSYFLTNWVLPSIGNSTGSSISAKHASISVLGGKITFDNFKAFKQNNFDVKISKLDLDFSFWDLIKSKITVNKLQLDDSFINIIHDVTKKDIKEESKIKYDDKEGLYNDENPEDQVSMPTFDINNVKIKNLNLTYHAIRPEEENSSTTIISNFNLNAPSIKTGGKGELTFESLLETVNNSKKQRLSGSIKGDLDLILNEDSFPSSLKFNSKMKLGEDVAPIKVNFTSRKKSGGKTPFKVDGTIDNLPLDPFLSLNSAYKESDGKLVSANFDFNGPDVRSANLAKTLSGELDAKVIKLYIPSNLLNNPIGKLIMLPIQLVATSGQYFSDDGKNSVSKTITESADVIDGIRAIDFANGEASISMNEGNIFIKEFLFNGDSNSVVQRLSIQGTITKNEKLDLNTYTMVTALAIPIKIRGTVQDPQADIARMIPAMLGSNISNIATFTKDGLQGIGNGLSKSGQDILNSAYGEENTKNTGADIDAGNFFNKVGKSLDDVIYGVKNAVTN